MVRVNTIKHNQKAVANKSVRKQKVSKAAKAKLRKSLTPGTVVIPLTGQFRGKHVVMLKQLEKSGMLLCSGPYKLNGCPLRRMNARYVIATSTKVDVSKVPVQKVTDAFFARAAEKKSKQGEADFSAKSEKKLPTGERKATQQAVDTALLAAIGKDALMKKYLSSKFALSNGQNAHDLKF